MPTPDSPDLAAEAAAEHHAVEIGTLRREREALKAENRGLVERVTDLAAQVDLLTALEGARSKPPRWVKKKGRKSDRQSVACAMLSDTHFDEVVNPDELGGANAYDRAIATARLERFFRRAVELCEDHFAGVSYEGFVLFLGGDLFSGSIHDELSETNEDTAFGSVLYYLDHVAAGIALLADRFGQVHVPSVVGNHGRQTRKPRAKRRVRDNLDWLFSCQLASMFRDDDRVTFQVPESADLLVDVAGTTFLLTHGDQVRGGGGIGGIWPPIMRMVAKKKQRFHFDIVVMGHWHQLITAPTSGLIVNGSLKGYDEFAATSNFSPERAQQALWLVHPDHGVTITAPVFCDDPKAEGWGS